MTIKTCKTAVRASTLLAAIALSGGAFATGGLSESFEGKTVGASMTAAMSKVGKTQREYWRKITRARYPYKLDAYPGYVGKKGGRLT
jgi:hypothetical protein